MQFKVEERQQATIKLIGVGDHTAAAALQLVSRKFWHKCQDCIAVINV